VRIATRVLAALVSLALLTGGLLVIAEIVSERWRHEPWILPYDTWYQSATTNQWATDGVRWLCLAIAASGLLLLVVAFAKRRPIELALMPDASTRSADVQRTSLERTLTRAADGVDGVSDASVRVTSKSANVAVRTPYHEPGDLQQRVHQAVTRRIADIDLATQLPIQVAVKREAAK
jgi:hypothetical protein